MCVHIVARYSELINSTIGTYTNYHFVVYRRANINKQQTRREFTQTTSIMPPPPPPLSPLPLLKATPPGFPRNPQKELSSFMVQVCSMSGPWTTKRVHICCRSHKPSNKASQYCAIRMQALRAMYKEQNVLLKKPAMYIGLSVKKERKLDCTHVIHNQLDPLPFTIIYTNIVLMIHTLHIQNVAQ